MQKAETAEFSPFDASQWRLGIVVAQFNKDITDQLLQSALERAAEYGLTPEHIDIITVAGSVEIPLVLQGLAKSGRYDALLALGCIIEGETAHFDYVCKFVTEGILRVQLDQQMPVGFGVLTCRNHEQAAMRAHLGGEYVDAVMHQAKAITDIA